MKRWIIVLLIILLSVPCAAAEDPHRLQESLPEDARKMLEDIEPGSTDVRRGVQVLVRNASQLFRKAIKESLKSGFLIAAACLLLGMIQSFSKSSGVQLHNRVTELTGSTVILLLTLEQNGTMLTLCGNTVGNLERFNQLLTGVFAAATAASGHPASAAATAAVTMVFSSVMFTAVKTLFLPAVVLYLLLIYSGIVGENNAMRQAAQVEKWAVGLAFKMSMTAYMAYLTFTGLVTGSADAAAVKTAQSLSSTVPLVGSVIAGASEALLSGASVLRAGIGLFGTLAAVAICLTPVVGGFCHLLIFRVLSVVTASFADGGIREMLNGVSNAYSMLLGILTACCAVQFLSIIVSMTVIR